jgi:hypothetical protein
MKIRLLLALAALTLGYTVPAFAQEKEPTPSASTPEVDATKFLPLTASKLCAEAK